MEVFHFIFHIQCHSMDHGLTFLIVCKEIITIFGIILIRVHLLLKAQFRSKQSRVTLSRCFCYYLVLFNAKKLHIWLSQRVCENLFLMYCLRWVQVRKCVLDISKLEVFFPHELKSGVSYSQNPMPLKVHVQYCSLIWLTCHQLFCSLKAILYMVGQLSI